MWSRALKAAPRHSVRNQWDLLAPLGFDACDPIARRGGDGGDRGGGPACRATCCARRASRPTTRSSSSMSAPAIRFAGGRRSLLSRRHRARAPRSGAAIHPDVRAIRRRRRASDRWTASGSVSARRHARYPTRQFDIAELRSLTARAAVYIGGDSGPLHIAATTQTPIVALFGPTLAERSMPWRDPRWFAEAIDGGPLPCRPCHQRTCEPGDFRCLTGIDPEPRGGCRGAGVEGGASMNSATMSVTRTRSR